MLVIKIFNNYEANKNIPNSIDIISFITKMITNVLKIMSIRNN